jgi:hypothetical protein
MGAGQIPKPGPAQVCLRIEASLKKDGTLEQRILKVTPY